jgi:hypothetical protein
VKTIQQNRLPKPSISLAIPSILVWTEWITPAQIRAVFEPAVNIRYFTWTHGDNTYNKPNNFFISMVE